MRSEYSSSAQRIRPDKGMLIKDHQPTLFFVTICTQGPKPWLATEANHFLLRTIWTEVTYWKIGTYITCQIDWPYEGEVFKPGFRW